MKKLIFFLLAALGAMVFPACEKDNPIEMVSFRIEVTRLSFVAPDGLSWDTGVNTPAPDVYAVFRPKGSTGGQVTAVTPNVSVIPFFLTGSFTERPSSTTYELLFFDSDANDILAGADDFIGGYEFELPQGTSRPNELIMDDPSILIGGKLHFTYQ